MSERDLASECWSRIPECSEKKVHAGRCPDRSSWYGLTVVQFPETSFAVTHCYLERGVTQILRLRGDDTVIAAPTDEGCVLRCSLSFSLELEAPFHRLQLIPDSQ